MYSGTNAHMEPLNLICMWDGIHPVLDDAHFDSSSDASHEYSRKGDDGNDDDERKVS